MDINVEKFQKDFGRFCASQGACTDCPLNELESGCYNIDQLTEVISIVQEWVEKNPVKTYLMDMKEKFPKLVSDDSFYDNYCVEIFYGRDFNCIKDCRNCWNREME